MSLFLTWIKLPDKRVACVAGKAPRLRTLRSLGGPQETWQLQGHLGTGGQGGGGRREHAAPTLPTNAIPWPAPGGGGHSWPPTSFPLFLETHVHFDKMPGFYTVLRLVPNEEVVEATLLGANLRDKEEKKQVWTPATRLCPR